MSRGRASGVVGDGDTAARWGMVLGGGGVVSGVWLLAGSLPTLPGPLARWAGLLGLVVTVAALVGLVVFGIGAGGLVYPWVSTRGRVRAEIGHRGFATVLEMTRRGVSTAGVLRRRAGYSWPRIVVMSPRARVTVAGQHAAYVGRVAAGPCWGWRVWTPHNEGVALIAAPQSGKTALGARQAAAHGGPLLATSTKDDQWALSHRQRTRIAKSGRRPQVFDPYGESQAGHNLWFPPLLGCVHPRTGRAEVRTTTERARDLVDGALSAPGASGEMRYFADQSKAVLKVLCLAAALDPGADFATVAYWVTHPDDTGPEKVLTRHTPDRDTDTGQGQQDGRRERHPDTARDGPGPAGGDAAVFPAAREVLDRYRGQVPGGWVDLLLQIRGTDHRQRDAIFNTLRLVTGCFDDPQVAEACRPPGGRAGAFDVEAFLDDRGSVFIVAGGDDTGSDLAPLTTALVGYIFRYAQRRAKKRGAALFPALMCNLDEVALVCPLPLHKMNPDAGGRGIHMIEICQTRSQLFARYGERDGETILNSLTCRMILGGLGDDAELESISRLCGTRPQQTLTINTGSAGGGGGPGRSYGSRDVRVLPPEVIRTLPYWHALVIYNGLAPIVVRYVPAWLPDPDLAAYGPLLGPLLHTSSRRPRARRRLPRETADRCPRGRSARARGPVSRSSGSTP